MRIDQFSRCMRCKDTTCSPEGRHSIEIYKAPIEDNYAHSNVYDLCDNCLSYLQDWIEDQFLNTAQGSKEE